MIRRNPNIRRAVICLGSAACLLGLAASPAAAAPSLGVELQRTEAVVHRNDERVDYTAAIKNTAAIDTGSTLTCAPNTWTNADVTKFKYQWLDDGASLGSANGAQTTTYTVQATDKGHSLQCQVTGVNSAETSRSAAVSAPAVVAPVPAPAPPTPSPATAAASRPTVTTVETTKRLCTPPTNWTGAPLTWAFQWLRNGEPIAGATDEKYTPKSGAGEEDQNKVLQCKVIGENATGKAAGISNNNNIGAPPTPPSNAVAQTPSLTGSEWTSGTVTVRVEVPNSPLTFVPEAVGTNWVCTRQLAFGGLPATASCTRSDPLAPGTSYPTIEVGAVLGTDLPEIAKAKASASGGGTAGTVTGSDEFTFAPAVPWEIQSFSAAVRDPLGNDDTRAGAHPYSAQAAFRLSRHRSPQKVNFTGGIGGEPLAGFTPVEDAKDITVDGARGFVGNALATPAFCPTVEEIALETCPAASAVGGIALSLDGIGFNLPIYSIEPEFGQPAEFAFGTSAKSFGGVLISFVPKLRADEGYAISFVTAPTPQAPKLLAANPVLCAFGANLDAALLFTGCRKNEPAENPNPIPLITNPTRCTGSLAAGLHVDSWQHPAESHTAEYPLPSATSCPLVHFEPEASLTPTSHRADSPTGLGVEITVPTEGLLQSSGCHEKQGDPSSPAAECVSQANLDTVSVTFPKGMSINPAAADGLSACSPAQIKLGSNAKDECPESSKVGTVEIDTPLIRETLKGAVFLAKQNDNPFNAPLGLYMDFDSPRDGVRIKVAGKLVTDPVTGQLTSVFTENPEAPFSRLALHFNSGPRAALINPPKCGAYAIRSEFSPWSAVNPANPTPAEIVTEESEFQVTEGPNGGPCPSGNLDPKLKAGLRNPQAGSKSTFDLTLSREDGSERFTGLNVTTPKGLTAYLKGIPYCPDATLAGISGAEETGRPQLANPSCPAASQVGTVLSGAGSGPFPFQAPGKVYLAGPYKAAPVSLAVVAPAVAGPFDLGNVVVRNGLYVDPETAQVTAKSDPIPTILHGILLDVRQIRLALDKPNFTAAPTNCEPQQVVAQVKGEQGGSATAAVQFGANGCENLAFKPKLALRLFGGTHRNAHPRLVAKLTYPPGSGYANIAGASVALPHSEFLDQAHIRTVCTRVQFAAHQCPQGAIYGHAEAVTPLLDNPVSGPVYLRSSDNPLPDLVAALRGPDNQPIEVVLVGRIDSVHGGIRSTFETVPDQPVSNFTLSMQGGKKGLLVNSRNLCKSVNRANAKFSAQNGRSVTLRPKLANACKESKAKKQKRHR